MSDLNTNPATVEDSLRTRIAAVLDKHYPQTTGYHDELTDWCQCGMPRSHVVDVLIRELRLTRETQSLGDGAGGISTNYKTGVTTSYLKPCTRQHRYVTDWTTDE